MCTGEIRLVVEWADLACEPPPLLRSDALTLVYAGLLCASLTAAVWVRRRGGGRRARPLVRFGLSLWDPLAAVAVGGGMLLSFWPGSRLPGPDIPWIAAGFAASALGGALQALAIRELGAMHGAASVVMEGQRVVEGGPYRLLRHPLYAGLLLLEVGQGLAFESWPLLGAAGVMASAFCRRIEVEERALLEVTGAAYRSYARRVRWRLLPGLW